MARQPRSSGYVVGNRVLMDDCKQMYEDYPFSLDDKTHD